MHLRRILTFLPRGDLRRHYGRSKFRACDDCALTCFGGAVVRS